MPVRFRCRHCNQLLGIARRKIGMEVSCPTCRRKVLVPSADTPDVDQPTVRKTESPFEGSDLDALLQPSAPGPLRAPQPPTAWSPPGPAPASPNVEPYNPPAAPSPGLVLSSFQATLLTVGMVLLLALFFAGGLLIGRFWF